jgi:hypothetical protein
MNEEKNVKTSTFLIENRTSRTMQFHIEPECFPFEIPAGKAAEVSGDYESEPITIQFSDDEGNGVFGAVFPGDGDVVVKVDGQDVTEIM